MNQISNVGFGTDATLLAGYAQHANASLGNVVITVENTGENSLYFQLKEYPVAASAGGVSGYGRTGPAITVVPKGVKDLSYNLVSRRVGFFGSGNTKANISISMRNKADLRGAQIDLVAVGRRGWGYDDAFNTGELTKNFGSPPDSPTTPSVS
jgi:hypothetical protein